MSTNTVNFNLPLLVPAQAQKAQTVNSTFQGFDDILGTRFSVVLPDSLGYTFASADALAFRYFSFTGTLANDVDIVVPDNSKEYIVMNGTTGGFSLTLKTSAGAGVVVAPDATVYRMLYCDGTDVVAITVT